MASSINPFNPPLPDLTVYHSRDPIEHLRVRIRIRTLNKDKQSIKPSKTAKALALALKKQAANESTNQSINQSTNEPEFVRILSVARTSSKLGRHSFTHSTSRDCSTNSSSRTFCSIHQRQIPESIIDCWSSIVDLNRSIQLPCLRCVMMQRSSILDCFHTSPTARNSATDFISSTQVNLSIARFVRELLYYGLSIKGRIRQSKIGCIN